MSTIRYWVERAAAILVGLFGLFAYASGFASLFGTTTTYTYGAGTTTTTDPFAGVFPAIVLAALALIPATVAHNKGRDKLVWWVNGVWFLPIALIIAFTMKPTVEAQDAGAEAEGRVKCPFCAEYIRPEAITCRWCGKDLPARDGRTAANVS